MGNDSLPELGLPIVLASASPRRRELLGNLVRKFDVLPSEVDEFHHEIAEPTERAIRIASDKAGAVAKLRPEALVIGADTIVAFEVDDTYVHLEKPTDSEDAKRMLRLLSGRTHLVITGVVLIWPAGLHSFSETTLVTFRNLSQAEIDSYVATGEPLDKAGGYAIQGGAAGFATDIEGSRDNVIGLPSEKLGGWLASFKGGR